MRIQNLLLAISMCLAPLAKAEIIQRGADGTEHGVTEQAQQLWEAVKANDVQTVQQLVTEKNVASFIYRGGEWLHRSRITMKSTLLHVAALNNNRDVAKLLIKMGAQVDARGYHGRTPLHLATEGNSLDVAELLIEQGAEVDARERHKLTPLHSAAKWNSLDIAELLIEQGAEVDARDMAGVTPLHYAARYESLGVVELLIEKGAQVDARDKNEITPLLIAVTLDRKDMAMLLTAFGAPLDIQNNQGDVNAQRNIMRPALTTFSAEIAPWLTQEAVTANVLHSMSEANKVAYAKVALGQGCYENAREIMLYFTSDVSRAELLLHIIMLQRGNAAYRERMHRCIKCQRRNTLEKCMPQALQNGQWSFPRNSVTPESACGVMALSVTQNSKHARSFTLLHAEAYANVLRTLCSELLTDEDTYNAIPYAVVHRIRNSRISASLLQHVCYRAKDVMAQYRDEHGDTLLHEMARQGISTGCSYLLAAIRDYYFQNPHTEDDINERLRCIVQNADKETPLICQLKSANEYQPLSCSLRYEDESALLDCMLPNNFGKTPRDIAQSNIERSCDRESARYHNFMQAYDEALATCAQQGSLHDMLKRKDIKSKFVNTGLSREQDKPAFSDITIITHQ